MYEGKFLGSSIVQLANRQHVTHPTIFKSHPIPFPIKEAISQKLTHEASWKFKPTIVLASCLWFHSIAMPRKLQFGIQFHWHCQGQCVQFFCHAFLIACYSCQHAIYQLIYFNKTVKYSIKAVRSYTVPYQLTDKLSHPTLYPRIAPTQLWFNGSTPSEQRFSCTQDICNCVSCMGQEI